MYSLLANRAVLVVEDEMLVLLMLEDMLADLGCERLLSAATVAHALELIALHPFDVALLDMNLNGEETYAVADALKARDVPFIFATGYRNSELKNGHSGTLLLQKPFSDSELKGAITTLLEA